MARDAEDPLKSLTLPKVAVIDTEIGELAAPWCGDSVVLACVSSLAFGVPVLACSDGWSSADGGSANNALTDAVWSTGVMCSTAADASVFPSWFEETILLAVAIR